MGLVVSTQPTIEPISLATAKEHLRLDSGSYADATASTISIAPDAWPITPAYGIVGTGVDRLNKETLVVFSVGSVAAGATLDYKIQESDLGVTYTDWPGQSYTQITAAGTYEKSYLGIKQYIRVVATVAVGAIDFGASVITKSYITDEDTLLGDLITKARLICETLQGRAYITRTYELTLDEWPRGILDLPMPPAIAITSIVYTDAEGTATTWSATEYQLDATGFVGRLTPAYGYVWPSTTLRTLAGIKITYTAGYGATAASVPANYRHAMLLCIGDLYENRENTDTIEHRPVYQNMLWLLGMDKVYSV
jgi:uncharacterized phiE125 gp8 family phage protein